MLQYKKQTAIDIQEIRLPDGAAAKSDLFQFNQEEIYIVVKLFVESFSF